jgi:hypothetical protein
MPGVAPALSDEQIWALIDFIRARNAGLAFAAGGGWPVALPAPGAELDCPNTAVGEIGDLRGHAVRVFAAEDAGTPHLAPVAGAWDVVLARTGVSAADCVASDPAAWTAYALVSGVAPERLAGTVLVIDAAGTLRRVFPPGAANLPADAASWSVLLQGIARTLHGGGAMAAAHHH